MKDLLIGIVGAILIFLMFCCAVWYALNEPESKKEAKQRQVEQEENLVLKPTYVGSVRITVYNYEGHDYIISDTGYACSIIHSESCECKNQ